MTGLEFAAFTVIALVLGIGIFRWDRDEATKEHNASEAGRDENEAA